jgi:drug/metabolite transporter (DMT)-like permease
MTSTDAFALDGSEASIRKGVLIMLAGFALFAIMNAIVKDLAATFPVNQIVFFRGAFGLLPMAVLLAATGVRPTFTLSRVASHLPHVLVMTTVLLTAYVAFGMLPLAEVTAIFFLSPILVALMSALFLKERIALRLWLAVGGGFAGVLLIARPSGLSADLGLVFGAGAAILGAVTMLQQRALSRQNQTLEIVFWFMALSTALMIPTLPLFWVTPDPSEWLVLVMMGIVSCVGQFLIILPLRYAPASRLAPVHYSNLLGGLVVGYLWFGEVPDTIMLLGCVIVVVSTGLVLFAHSPVTTAAAIDAVEILPPDPAEEQS